jgi:hypothetical protein
MSGMKCYRLQMRMSAEDLTKSDEHTIVLYYNFGDGGIVKAPKPEGDPRD